MLLNLAPNRPGNNKLIYFGQSYIDTGNTWDHGLVHKTANT